MDTDFKRNIEDSAISGSYNYNSIFYSNDLNRAEQTEHWKSETKIGILEE